MENQELIKKWLSAFGEGVPKSVIKERVTARGNYLWHLFTWGNVPCIKGDAARKAFDELKYTKAICFYDGYSNQIEQVGNVEKLSAQQIDAEEGFDVYIVATDFSWTYVRTHEDDLGPYFCVKN